MVALINPQSSPVVVASPGLDCCVKSHELKRAVAALARFTDRKSCIPMLHNIALRVDTHGLTLAATDLNVCATVTLPVTGMLGTGSVCVNAKSLADFVKTMDGTEIRIAQTGGGNGLAISDAASNMTLIGTNSRDWPKLPAVSDERILSGQTVFHPTVPEAFADMLERVGHAVCKDETRFHLNGILIECSGTTTRMVTTDGHRLTRHDAPLTGAPTTKSQHGGVILPQRAATEIAKLCKAHKGYECTVAYDGPHMFVKVGGYTIAAKLIDAQFPKYDQVIPKDHENVASVERKPLVAALKRAAKVCLKTRGIKLSFASGKLTITCDHPDTGTTTESMKASSEWLDLGGTGFFGVNPNYLLDLLGEIDDAWVTIAFNDKLDPILVRSTEDATSYSVAGSRFLGVVMPMRI